MFKTLSPQSWGWSLLVSLTLHLSGAEWRQYLPYLRFTVWWRLKEETQRRVFNDETLQLSLPGGMLVSI